MTNKFCLIFKVQAELRAIEQNQGYQRNNFYVNHPTNASQSLHNLPNQSIIIGPSIYGVGSQNTNNVVRPQNNFNFEDWSRNNDTFNNPALRPPPQISTVVVENQSKFIVTFFNYKNFIFIICCFSVYATSKL